MASSDPCERVIWPTKGVMAHRLRAAADSRAFGWWVRKAMLYVQTMTHTACLHSEQGHSVLPKDLRFLCVSWGARWLPALQRTLLVWFDFLFLLGAHTRSSETHHKVHVWKTSKCFLTLPVNPQLPPWGPGADFLGLAQHWLLHPSLAGFKLFKHRESRYFPRQLLHMWQGLRFNKGFQKQPSASELCKTLLYKKLASPSQRALLASLAILFLFFLSLNILPPTIQDITREPSDPAMKLGYLERAFSFSPNPSFPRQTGDLQ